MKQILLIDDDPITNYINQCTIKKKFPNTEILIFEKSNEALNYLERYTENTYLIFLDLNIPIMDGWELLDKILEKRNKLKVKINILSSSVDSADINRAKEYKIVSSYLIKPMKFKDLDKIVF
ncbi:Response regulator receiver domain-containing protein [Salegentibacter echinorum]|uniref:Response regulator receiver domain-containing protein n=1 Tax=Salegentibacter echinorum TaxID=1073325 RepID=A0A1M5JK71_SALEC|nr:response regulator [Salegentibacter echinorum]SHG40433.1 Response regulator receiver domain-containing protein [Salegentibacter echinorum]